MKQLYERQEIAQLLSKFMAGETSVAEEEVLAQYFRTHEVDEEWAEYKEMFTLFDNGEVDIEPGIQNVQRSMFRFACCVPSWQKHCRAAVTGGRENRNYQRRYPAQNHHSHRE